jgi:hypothetical protein
MSAPHRRDIPIAGADRRAKLAPLPSSYLLVTIAVRQDRCRYARDYGFQLWLLAGARY